MCITGGGGGSDKISELLKNVISDVRPPKIRYHAFAKKNQISGLKNQLSDITPPP